MEMQQSERTLAVVIRDNACYKALLPDTRFMTAQVRCFTRGEAEVDVLSYGFF